MPKFYSVIGGKSHIYYQTKTKKFLQISKKYIIMLIVEIETKIERIIHTFSVLAYVCLHSHKKQNKIHKYRKVLFAYRKIISHDF